MRLRADTALRAAEERGCNGYRFLQPLGKQGLTKQRSPEGFQLYLLVLGRIWPTRVEVKGDPGIEVISRNYQVGSVCLRHQMPTRGKFWKVRPTW